jgi:glycosyltransferase involved in cell wall biosynthesis
MEIKHVYWFAYFNLSEPSVRYRAKFPLQKLKEKYGISYSIVYPGYDYQNISNFLKAFFSALFFRKKNSIIVFQKIYTNGFYTFALKMLLFFRPKYTLYDIDDAEHTRRPTNTIHHFMENCSACSAGSKSLIEYIKQFNQNAFLLTSPVIDHGLIKGKLEKKLTVGWIGYYGAHRMSLTQLFFPALKNINFPLKLKLLGVKDETEKQEIKSYFKENKNISIDTPLSIDWLDEQSIYETIKTFDIGVSPLLDNEFNRAKSAFKLKQYLSCGVPVLASSVGENKEFLEDGVNGYLCDSPIEYFQKLESINNSKDSIYSKLNIHAKSTFPKFSIDNYCSIFINYFK